jgi:alkylhydroperoxidase/carboxymuconolactone decarboxylase family protein YurZ
MQFLHRRHAATTTILMNDQSIADQVKADMDAATLSNKMKALLKIAKAAGKGGKNVTEDMVVHAKAEGATDLELHDTVLISALFSLYNRYVDGLARVTPTDPAFYDRLGNILKDKGYLPSENRYSNL